jgi:hypothetical protein
MRRLRRFESELAAAGEQVIGQRRRTMKRELICTLALLGVLAWIVPADAQGRRRGAPAPAVESPPAVAPQAVPAQPAPPAVTTQPAPAAQDTTIQGQVVRVIGQNQVVVRTPDGKEMVVNVNPQTAYTLNDRTAQLTDLQPGSNIGVSYYMQDQRPIARRIFTGPIRNR